MLTCPHCGGKALGWWGRLSVAPLRSRTCMACGSAIRASWWSIPVVVLPPMAAFVAGNLLLSGYSFQRDLWLAAAGATVGLVAFLFVPLVRRDT